MSLILGVVDDESTARLLKVIGESQECEIIVTDSDSPQFPNPTNEPISLVIFDLNPERDIYKVCHRFKPAATTPTLVILNEESSKRIPELMKAGATDCVIKPLRVAELTARIQSILERAHKSDFTQLPIFRCKHLTVNPVARKVYRDGNEIQVTPIDFRLLVFFMEHMGEVVTKEQLLREVWRHSGGFEDSNLVDSAIRRLRRDIGEDSENPECLHTVWGVGYRFEESG